MAESEDRIFEAMLRIRAIESDWASHMFVFPTDKRIWAAALDSGHACRIVEDDGMIVMCRDASGDGTPWAPSGLGVRASDRGFGITELGQRALMAIDRASQSAAVARDAVARSRASREAYVSARASRMRLSLGV
jgi:hypothetical protein